MEKWLPTAFALLGGAALVHWFFATPELPAEPRLPAATLVHEPFATDTPSDPATAGRRIPGPGVPSNLTGAWPCFRGAARDGLATTKGDWPTNWPADGPPRLWQVDVGEGYAGPAIWQGRVYLHDYDAAQKLDAIRCLSFDDGREIWRYVQPLMVKRNHGMSRTTPAVSAAGLVAIDPKCRVTCLDPLTGELRWQIDLARDFGAEIPPWYAGQCPLIDGETAILAPGGADLLIAVDLADGRVRWRTPNAAGWKMSHASVTPLELGGRKTWVYAAAGGVVGVDAADGRELWRTDRWKIRIATIASPVALPPEPAADSTTAGGRLLLAGGYDAGALLLALDPPVAPATAWTPREIHRLPADQFGATQQTPVASGDFVYGIRPDGELCCLDFSGAVRWHSGSGARFGLGPLLIVDDRIFAVDDSGTLVMCRATAEGYRELGRFAVLQGHDAWGPLAFADGRLLMRDLTRLVCVQVGVRR